MRLKTFQQELKRKAEDLERNSPQKLRFKPIRICRPKVILNIKPMITSLMLEHDSDVSNQYYFYLEKLNNSHRLSVKEMQELNSLIFQLNLELASAKKTLFGIFENSGFSEINFLKHQIAEVINEVNKNSFIGNRLEELLKDCNDTQMSLDDDSKIEELKMNHITQRIEVVKAYNQQIVKQIELLKSQLDYKHETSKAMIKKCENEGELLKSELLIIETSKKNIDIIAKSNKNN